MTVVDSSAWLHYFGGTALADRIAARLENRPILVPSIVVYEVYKALCRASFEDAADRAIAWLSQQTVVPLDQGLALHAADLSLDRQLAMADAIVYATAQAHEATLVTCDKHLASLPGVEYIALEGD